MEIVTNESLRRMRCVRLLLCKYLFFIKLGIFMQYKLSLFPYIQLYVLMHFFAYFDATIKLVK